LTISMFNFFKKNKQPTVALAPAEMSLANIEFHTMPEKFKNAGGTGTAASKKFGLVIVVGGGLILIAGVVLLSWYVYQSGGKKPVSQIAPVEQSETPAVTPEAPLESAEQTDTSAAEDLTEKDCGGGLFNGSAADYETDAFLVCLGERINNGCLPAAGKITDEIFGEIKLSVLGLRQDKCLAQIDYPDAYAIASDKMKIYANTYAQCLYGLGDLSSLNYQPGQLAAYIYEQTSVNNIGPDNGNCLGTAVDRSREQAKFAGEEETAAQAGVDADGDLLTDLEETAVFATNINKSDTDGDGYSDGAEVLNLYNPAGVGKLADSGLIAEYLNGKYGYVVFYPKSFHLEDQLGGDNVFFFSGVDGSIQILTQDNPDKEDIKSWYARLVGTPAADITQTVSATKNNLEYIYSPDGLTAYVTLSGGGGKIFVLTYSPEESGAIQFKTVLQIMINSFQLK